MELIKINPDHYIVVDDSKIKIDDFYIDDSNTVRCAITEVESYWTHRKHYKKVTHSTKPLEDVTVLVRPDGSDVSETIFDKVKEISLSKVKKIIGEVDMEELELKYHKKLMERREIAKNFRGQVAGNHPDMFTSREMLSMMEGFTDGYTQALEDTKNKKTIWEVEFIGGELKLI
mgnify:CR=1 FL=1|tara:strand:- start:2019 stop:2540 length:522 start_codon:yes stop_codon:yes gene_type:complete